MGRMWMGTRGYERWVPDCSINPDFSQIGYSNVSRFLNGGASSKRSKASSKQYNMTWNMKRRDELRFITDLAQGLYDAVDGVNLIYFLDPMAMERNVLSQMYASPMQGAVDGMPWVPDYEPKLVPTGDATQSYPVRSAVYALKNSDVSSKVYIPIPPGYVGWVGVHGISSGASVRSARVRPGGQADSPMNLPTLSVNDVTRVGSAFKASDGLIGIELDLGIDTPGTFGWTGTANASTSTWTRQGSPTLTNYVQNPAAEGATASLAAISNGSVAMVADAVTGPGTRSYKSTSTAATISSFGLRAAERPAAVASQRWHLRAKARLDAALLGARSLRSDIIFRDSSGAVLSASSNQLDVVPDGVFNRWTGTANASTSERYEGTTKRTNRAPNPINGASLTGLSAARATTSLIDDYVRCTVTDATAGAFAQRLQAGSTSAGTYAIPVTAGETLSFSVELRTSTAQNMGVQVLFYDASSTLLSAVPVTNIAVNAATFTRYAASVVVPANAVRTYWYFGTGPATNQVGDTFDVRRFLVGDSGAYFDGSSTSTGTGNTQKVVELVSSAVAPTGTATADFALYRNPDYQAAAGDVVYFDALSLVQSNDQEDPPYFSGATTSSPGSITLSGIMVQILPEGRIPLTGGFISGQGNAGCEFEADPVQTPFNEKLDRVGMSAKLIETGPWL